MGYIKNLTNEIIIDAVLTKAGRKKLANSGKLDIVKFSLSDDEVDYSLYNISNPNGSDDYDIAIRKLPILEATTGELSSLRYKLYTTSVSSGGSSPSILSITLSIPTQLKDGLTEYGINYTIRPSILGLTDLTVNNVYYRMEISGVTSRQLSYVSLNGLIDQNKSSSEILAAQMNEAERASGWSKEVTSLIAYGHSFNVMGINKISPATTYKIRIEALGGSVGVTAAEDTIVFDIPQLPSVNPGIGLVDQGNNNTW